LGKFSTLVFSVFSTVFKYNFAVKMKLSFDDTKIAFAHKSMGDLRKAYRLFQAFSYPFLVVRGPGIANFALSIGIPIKGLIKNTLFHQFCGGETIEESFPSAKQLYDNGIGAILDYSVEGEGNKESYEHSFKELSKVIDEASIKDEYPFAVFKCTGIGTFEVFEKVASGNELTPTETQDFEDFKARVGKLCKQSFDKNVKLFIDAEESWIQDPLDAVTYQNMELYNKEHAIVYNTIQLYRKGRIEEMEKQIAIAREKGYKIGYKLVRGAYMEKEGERAQEMNYPNPIQDSKENTDRDYNRAIQLCFDNRDIVSVCAGTHNEESSYMLAQLIQENNIAKKDDRFWFAQLYGMSDHISFNLAQSGYNVAKYLPYGPVREVLPYLSRRAQENTSVKGQAGRELALIMKEIKRRQSAK
jgi:proline dehydrogenase